MASVDDNTKNMADPSSVRGTGRLMIEYRPATKQVGNINSSCLQVYVPTKGMFGVKMLPTLQIPSLHQATFAYRDNSARHYLLLTMLSLHPPPQGLPLCLGECRSLDDPLCAILYDLA